MHWELKVYLLALQYTQNNKLESEIHYSFGFRNPICGIRNPRSRIRNPSSGTRNPNTSWITSHGANLSACAGYGNYIIHTLEHFHLNILRIVQ